MQFHLPRYVDCHCHLLDSSFDLDRDDVIDNAKRAGLFCIVESTLVYDEISRALTLSQKSDGFIRVSIGFDCTNFTEDPINVIDRIKQERAHIIGIGEVGLDYYWVRDDQRRAIMVERFKSFVAIAIELRLPLIVHSRSAGKFAVGMLREWGAKRVLLHAFDGGSPSVLQGLEAGYYFSIPPSVVRSEQKRRLTELVPLKRLLLESDSPVLSPVPHVRNQPENVKIVANEVASIKSLPLDEIERATYDNFIFFFGLSYDARR